MSYDPSMANSDYAGPWQPKIGDRVRITISPDSHLYVFSLPLESGEIIHLRDLHGAVATITEHPPDLPSAIIAHMANNPPTYMLRLDMPVGSRGKPLAALALEAWFLELLLQASEK